MGWEGWSGAAARLLTHPVFLVSGTFFLFLLLAWLALPFAVYGLRSRLDAIAARLDAILGALERLPAPGGEQPEGAGERARARLRRALLGLSPALRERAAGPSESAFLLRGGGGEETPLVSVSVSGGTLRLSFPVAAWEGRLAGVSADGFAGELSGLLGEMPGVRIEAGPLGREVRVEAPAEAEAFAERLAGALGQRVVGPMGGGGS